MMEVTLSNIITSLVYVIIISLIWRTLNWLWFKPKTLERRLKTQGFRSHSYRVLYGDTKEIAEMVKQTTSKPMEHFSNDYIPRIFPFDHQTIKNYGITSSLSTSYNM